MAGTLICFGDSNTWGFDSRSYIGERYPENIRWTGILESETEWKVENHGINGRQIPHTPGELSLICEQMKRWSGEPGPVLMLIKLGGNDLVQNPGWTAEQVAERMEAFLKLLLEQPEVRTGKIHVVLVAPAKVRRGSWITEDRLVQEGARLEECYRVLAEKLGVSFISTGDWDVDVLYDGVHYSEDGHRRFAEHMKEALAGLVNS